MRLEQVAKDDAIPVSGFERHTFVCSACGDIEQRCVFSSNLGHHDLVALPAAPPISPSATMGEEVDVSSFATRVFAKLYRVLNVMKRRKASHSTESESSKPQIPAPAQSVSEPIVPIAPALIEPVTLSTPRFSTALQTEEDIDECEALLRNAIGMVGRARTKSRRGRKVRPWKVPDGIHDLSVPFSIDREIRAARLQSRWAINEAVTFGRRVLEVAVEDAADYERYRPGEAFAYWTRMVEWADRAHEALDRLVRYIGPSGVRRSDIVLRGRVPSTMARSGKIRISVLLGQPTDQAKKDTDGLLAARDLLAEFAGRSRQRRNTLAGRRKKTADLGKRAFVYRLAEGWIFLTGKRPARSFHRNPFLRFVKAAWADAGFGSTNEDFSRALDTTLMELASYEGWSWSKQSQQTVSGLAQKGPVWA
jgi:hypothetical protein